MAEEEEIPLQNFPTKDDRDKIPDDLTIPAAQGPAKHDNQKVNELIYPDAIRRILLMPDYCGKIGFSVAITLYAALIAPKITNLLFMSRCTVIDMEEKFAASFCSVDEGDRWGLTQRARMAAYKYYPKETRNNRNVWADFPLLPEYQSQQEQQPHDDSGVVHDQSGAGESSSGRGGATGGSENSPHDKRLRTSGHFSASPSTSSKNHQIYRGNHTTDATKFPYVVAISQHRWPGNVIDPILDAYKYFPHTKRIPITHCTGSLINGDYVLTAAHCVTSPWNTFYVTAGTACRPEFGGVWQPGAQTRRVVSVKIRTHDDDLRILEKKKKEEAKKRKRDKEEEEKKEAEKEKEENEDLKFILRWDYRDGNKPAENNPQNPDQFEPGLPKYQYGKIHPNMQIDIAVLRLESRFDMTSDQISAVRFPTPAECGAEVYSQPWTHIPSAEAGNRKTEVTAIGWGQSRHHPTNTNREGYKTWLQFYNVPPSGTRVDHFITAENPMGFEGEELKHMEKEQPSSLYYPDTIEANAEGHRQATEPGDLRPPNMWNYNFHLVPRVNRDDAPCTAVGDSGGPWVKHLTGKSHKDFTHLQFSITQSGFYPDDMPDNERVTGRMTTSNGLRLCYSNMEWIVKIGLGLDAGDPYKVFDQWWDLTNRVGKVTMLNVGINACRKAPVAKGKDERSEARQNIRPVDRHDEERKEKWQQALADIRPRPNPNTTPTSRQSAAYWRKRERNIKQARNKKEEENN